MFSGFSIFYLYLTILLMSVDFDLSIFFWNLADSYFEAFNFFIDVLLIFIHFWPLNFLHWKNSYYWIKLILSNINRCIYRYFNGLVHFALSMSYVCLLQYAIFLLHMKKNICWCRLSDKLLRGGEQIGQWPLIPPIKE